MSKKTLEFAIELGKQLNNFSLEGYTPITFLTKKLGGSSNPQPKKY